MLYCDIAFILFAILIVVHWFVFKHECIISYFEKRILDPNYKLGQDPLRHPSLFIGFNTSMQNPIMVTLMVLIWLGCSINIACVLARILPHHKIAIVVATVLAYSIFISYALMKWYLSKPGPSHHKTHL